jgi:hypothetical protein
VAERRQGNQLQLADRDEQRGTKLGRRDGGAALGADMSANATPLLA